MFITTNVRLDEDTHRAVKLLAVDRRVSAAEIIRDAIDRYLTNPPTPGGDAPPEQDPFFQVIGLVNTGTRDGSLRHDHYIYGTPKQRKK